MPNIDDWIRKLASTKRTIRVRAANVLLDRAAFVPLDVLIAILKEFSSEGLGASESNPTHPSAIHAEVGG